MKASHRSIMTAVFAVLLALSLAACGATTNDNIPGAENQVEASGGMGGGHHGGDGDEGRIAVIGDYSGSEIADFLTDRGLDVDNFPNYGDSITPYISGDYVVWEDKRDGNSEIYAYRISTGEEFSINSSGLYPKVNDDYIFWYERSHIYAYRISTDERLVIGNGLSEYAVGGDYVVWTDNPDLYAYRLSTGEEFLVSSTSNNDNVMRSPVIDGDYISYTEYSANPYSCCYSYVYAYRISTGEEIKVSNSDSAYNPRIDGDYIVWEDDRSGNYDIYAYEISTGEEFAVTTADNDQTDPQIDGDYIVWQDYRNGSFFDIYLSSTDLSVSEQKITKGKEQFDTADVENYSMILFGSELLSQDYVLSIFDAADAAGVNMLGIGIFRESDYGSGPQNPLGSILADDGRFGLSYDYDSINYPTEINVTADSTGHPIFNGIDTSSTISVDSSRSGGLTVYFTDRTDPDSPADWTVLATMQTSIDYFGDPAIVEFSTPNGTKVILDGASSAYENSWTDERWCLLYNEVVYLMD